MVEDGYTPIEQERVRGPGPEGPRPLHEAADWIGPGKPHFLQAASPFTVEALLSQKVHLLCAIAKQASNSRYQASFQADNADDAAIHQAASRVEQNALAALDECVAVLRKSQP